MLSHRLKEYLDTNFDEMLKLLERLVNIDSGSACKGGIDEVASIMAEEYEKAGFETELLIHPHCGNGLIVRKPGTKGRLLLICHLDTAFPEGSARKNPFRLEGNMATGPGVLDMKVCLVNCLYALKALYALGVKPSE